MKRSNNKLDRKRASTFERVEEYTDAEWQALHKWCAESNNVIWLYPPANVKLNLARQLRHAVRAAIRAYARTGHMLDAALAYAAHGFPVFPLTVDKTPVPKRDKDASGKPIPGTGSFKKATCDPIQIHAWWKAGPRYLIGLPMGMASGVWCLDIDTSEDHADGVAQWNTIAAGYDPIITREHRSATGGPHLIFNYHADQLNGCSKGALPKGIEVKSQGSYIVVPPSRRKGRSYTVYRDIDPADQPQWLTDLILQGRSRSSGVFTGQVTADLDEVADALAFIPNDDEDWEEWKSMALRIYAATNGEGFELFDAWSQKSEAKYDLDETLEAWEQVQSSPPNRTGAEKIFKMAREHGWVRKAQPPPPVVDEIDVETARRETRRSICDLLERVALPESEMDVWQQFYFEQRDPDWPLVRAVWVDTGVGKTEQMIEELAKWLRTVTLEGPIIYVVPGHKLSPKILEKFAERGINARIFHGRNQDDPEHRSRPMCRNPIAVGLALECHADITSKCCYQSKQKRCRFYDGPNQCGYQRQQIDAGSVEVWIVAGDMLFHSQKAFGTPAAVIIDESFWRKGIRGIESGDKTKQWVGEDKTKWLVGINWLLGEGPFDFMKEIDQRDHLRNHLGEALQQQEEDGSVERRHLNATLDVKDCELALHLEWKLLPQLALEPGMTDEQIKVLGEDKELIEDIRRTRRIIRIWEAVRGLLQRPETALSGRLTLRKLRRRRVIEWKGVARIGDQFWVPTLLLDATLPDLPILQVYHPQVEKVAHIKVKMPPSVHIRQVLHAPTSSRKLDDEKHLAEIHRYILQRHLEFGRQPTLVISQMKVEDWLKTQCLPESIHLEHYNNISGIDIYRDVRLLILVGRIAPGPREMEALAAALSGAKPIEVQSNANGFIWYPPVKRVIRLQDGSGRETSCDQHPDAAFGEPVRWLVHEGELIQGIGRARGVNRKADNPLDVDLLFDSCLPITVNDVMPWRAPSLLVTTATEGHMLTAPVDMMKLRPDLWPNDKAAYRTVKGGVPMLPGFVPITYQLKGAKMKQRVAYFDRRIIPDPRAWLEAKLKTPLQW